MLRRTLDRGVDRVSSLSTTRPWTCFGVQIFVHLMLCLVLFSSGSIMSDSDDTDWLVPTNRRVEIFDAHDQASEDVDPIGERDALRAWSNEDWITKITYTSESDNDSVFTPDNLRQMCLFEREFVIDARYGQLCVSEDEGVTCARQRTSVVELFYAALNGTGQVQAAQAGCPLLDAQDVADFERDVIEGVNGTYSAADRVFYGFFLSRDAVERGYSVRTKSILTLGEPLTNSTKKDDGPYEDFLVDVGGTWSDAFGLEDSFLHSRYRNDAIAPGGTLNVKWVNAALLDEEFERMISTDMFMAIASVLFVFFWLRVHTGSCALAAAGMYQIVMSIPISLCIYRFIFQITYFTSLHQMTIFLVLGIGADDIFVLTDGWRLHADIGDDAKRMRKTYARTMKAVFHTSFTTISAFTAMAVSPIIPMRTFGIFAAIAILVNFLEVISFTPAVLVLSDSGACACCCRRRGASSTTSNGAEVAPREKRADIELAEVVASKPSADTSASDEAKGSVSSPNDDDDKTSDVGDTEGKLSDPFLDKYYLSWLHHTTTTKDIPVCAWIVVAVCGAIAAFLLASAAQLETPEEVERWFPKDHMFEVAQVELREDFMAGSLDEYVDVSFLWGIRDVDRAGFDYFGTNTFRGYPVYDDALDLYLESSQTAIAESCTTIREYPCTSSGCQYGLLALPGTMTCFVTEFWTWHASKYANASTFAPDITREQFNDRLALFRCGSPTDTPDAVCGEVGGTTTNNGTAQTTSATDWSERIGIVDGELKYVAVDYTSSLRWRTPYKTRMPVIDTTDALTAEIRAEQQSLELGITESTGGHFWAWTVTEKELVDSLFRGFSICFPIAFLVLLTATGNLVIATYAIATIALIVGCVLGSVRFFLGWGLGVGEAIAGIIVVGFSVDYVVHLGHMYDEADPGGREGKTRVERVRFAAYSMARTVAAGGVTTLGAGLMMLPCQVTFFPKMAILISSTISFSLIYSLGFFMALSTVVGPEGSFGNVASIAQFVRERSPFNATANKTLSKDDET